MVPLRLASTIHSYVIVRVTCTVQQTVTNSADT